MTFPRRLALEITADAGTTSLSGSCEQPCLQPVDHLNSRALEHSKPLLRLTSATSKAFDWLRCADG